MAPFRFRGLTRKATCFAGGYFTEVMILMEDKVGPTVVPVWEESTATGGVHD